MEALCFGTGPQPPHLVIPMEMRKRGETRGRRDSKHSGHMVQAPGGCSELHLLGKTTFLTLGPCCQSKGGNESSALLAQSGSRNGRQEKVQGHVPWGLFMPGNASVFLCVTQTKTSPQMTCTLGSHAQNKAQRQHLGKGEAASG